MDKKIYLFSGPHPIYKSLVDYPPKGFSYVSNVTFSSFESIEVYKKGYQWKKKWGEKFFSKLKIPRMIYLPKARKADLIFSCRGFIILNNKPWVIEIEHADSFGGKNANKKIIEKALSSKNCKAIISRGPAVTSSLLSQYNGKNFKDKIVEIPPAMVLPKNTPKKKKGKKVSLLFISGYPSFYRKGGRELLEAFTKLEKKYDIELLMRAEVPEDIRKKYSSKNIKFISEKIPYSKIYEKLYSKADIFVLPTYFDAYGLVFLEAMAAGIPCVGTDIFSVPEIIQNKKNGFLINSPISDYEKNGRHKDPGLSEEKVKKMDLSKVTNQLIEKLSLLIENPQLRKKMGNQGRKMIKSGKFSITERNKKLKKIYEKALS